MNKKYTPTGRSCRVTFELPAQITAKKANLCGEFNHWDPKKHPMKRRKDGSFHLDVSLKPGREYRFRYLLDGKQWENDWSADKYMPNDHGTDDSVVIV